MLLWSRVLTHVCRSQYAGQLRLRGVQDVVPFCYGTVAWYIGKKVRRARHRRTRAALTRRVFPFRAFAACRVLERPGRALAPLDGVPARR
jgi:hypothetical protein